VRDTLAVPTDRLGADAVLSAARTSMSSKIIGPRAEHFARLIVDAVQSVRYETDEGKVSYPISAISVLKSHGRSALDSALIPGLALAAGRASQQMPRHVARARIALLDFNLQKHRMQLGVQVLVSDPAKLEQIR
jgi:T-complex protein 1 subunit alpha